MKMYHSKNFFLHQIQNIFLDFIQNICNSSQQVDNKDNCDAFKSCSRVDKSDDENDDNISNTNENSNRNSRPPINNHSYRKISRKAT